MSGNAIRIIIAEDHAVVREGTRRLLEREPDLDVVGEGTNGLEAVELVEQWQPDVALLDLSMPVLSGIEATERIKQRGGSTAVLILTAHDEEAYILAALRAGAAGYLLKDSAAAEVVNAIRMIHAGEPVLHPAVARKVLARFSPAAGTPDRVVVAPLHRVHLTPRELEVLQLAATGMSNAQIASRLAFSVRTTQVHMSRIFEKLGACSRTEAVIAGLRLGFVSLQNLDAG